MCRGAEEDDGGESAGRGGAGEGGDEWVEGATLAFITEHERLWQVRASAACTGVKGWREGRCPQMGEHVRGEVGQRSL